jgi:hypothetical protein
MFLRSVGFAGADVLGLSGRSYLVRGAAAHASVSFRSFLLRGFFVFLTYMPHVLPALPTVAQLPLRGHVQAGQPRHHPLFRGTVPLSALWGQWLAFFNILTYLVAARTALTVVGHSDLTVLARALSWVTWRSSF